MKKLILSELLLLFLATTFVTDSPPPGWYQQILPRSDVTVQDIFFIDSLKGWVVSRKNTNDSAFVFSTTNGGTNWNIQFGENIYLTSIQFTDANTGYSVGSAPGGIIKKTINGGLNWFTVNILAGYPLTDLSFVNRDTGWVCSNDPFSGGIFKTINGGLNWQTQLGASFSIKKLFFINSDTGWAGSDEANGKLYRTTTGGQVWNLQYTTSVAVNSIFFLSGLKGWIRAGGGNGVAYTTDGGFNWTSAQGVFTGADIRFVNDSDGYAGSVPNVTKSIDGGKTWGFQITPANTYSSVYALRDDSLLAWAGTYNFIKTTDGGGPFVEIKQITNEIPISFKLYQNYPNPFNPNTKIKYDVKRQTVNVKLIVYDIRGKLISELVNEKHNPGTYEADFSGEGLSSGIYFYKITITTEKEVYSDTKRMILVK